MKIIYGGYLSLFIKLNLTCDIWNLIRYDNFQLKLNKVYRDFFSITSTQKKQIKWEFRISWFITLTISSKKIYMWILQAVSFGKGPSTDSPEDAHSHLQTVAEFSLQWRHNEQDGVSNHQPHDGLLIVYSGADQRKHQSSASMAFVGGIHQWPVNSPHKWPVTQKIFPFYDVIMTTTPFPPSVHTFWTPLWQLLQISQCCSLSL